MEGLLSTGPTPSNFENCLVLQSEARSTRGCRCLYPVYMQVTLYTCKPLQIDVIHPFYVQTILHTCNPCNLSLNMQPNLYTYKSTCINASHIISLVKTPCYSGLVGAVGWFYWLDKSSNCWMGKSDSPQFYHPACTSTSQTLAMASI